MGFVIILVVGFVLMWLLIILPQRRRQAAHQSLISRLAVGDEVITAGGLYGTVTAIGDDELGLRVAAGVDVRVAKRAIAAVVPPDDDNEEEALGLEDGSEPVDQDRSYPS